MRKPDFCICENKGADQLHSNCAADQRLYFCYLDRTIPLLPKNPKVEASSHLMWFIQPGLCQTWSRKNKTEDRFSHDAAHISEYCQQ